MTKTMTKPTENHPINVDLLVQKLESLEPTIATKERRAFIALVFDTIESKMAAGVIQADIVQSLNESGLKITTSQLRQDLHHIRQERGISIKPRQALGASESSAPKTVADLARDRNVTMTRPTNPREAVRNARKATIDLDSFAKLNAKKD